MTDQSEHEGLRAHVRDLQRQIVRLRAEHMAARDTALEEAAKCAIDNQDCDAWEIAAAIRALKGAKT